MARTLLAILLFLGIPVIAFLFFVITYRKLDRYVSGVFMQHRTTFRVLPRNRSPRISNPLLFNIYMSFVKSTLPLSISAFIYADDIAIYCPNPSIKYVTHQLNIALENVHKHFSSLGLSLSKSVVTFYSLNSLCNIKWSIKKCQVNIRLNNVNIKIDWTVKFLGVHIDYAFKWKKTCC